LSSPRSKANARPIYAVLFCEASSIFHRGAFSARVCAMYIFDVRTLFSPHTLHECQSSFLSRPLLLS